MKRRRMKAALDEFEMCVSKPHAVAMKTRRMKAALHEFEMCVSKPHAVAMTW